MRFRVQGLGLRIHGLVVKDQGSDQGLRFTVYDLWF